MTSLIKIALLIFLHIHCVSSGENASSHNSSVDLMANFYPKKARLGLVKFDIISAPKYLPVIDGSSLAKEGGYVVLVCDHLSVQGKFVGCRPDRHHDTKGLIPAAVERFALALTIAEADVEAVRSRGPGDLIIWIRVLDPQGKFDIARCEAPWCMPGPPPPPSPPRHSTQ